MQNLGLDTRVLTEWAAPRCLFQEEGSQGDQGDQGVRFPGHGTFDGRYRPRDSDPPNEISSSSFIFGEADRKLTEMAYRAPPMSAWTPS
jgi:hypothetical protein